MTTTPGPFGRRTLLAVVVLLALVGGLADVAPASPFRPGAAAPTSRVSWLSAGDSYASGEGIAGTGVGDDCARSRLAFGPLAAELLRRQRGWLIDADPLVACTGALSGHIFDSARLPDGTARPSQVAQADDTVRQSGSRFDVVTLSTGGNDIGFDDLVKDCLVITPRIDLSWDEVLFGHPLRPAGCTVSPEEVERRIDVLVGRKAPSPDDPQLKDGLPALYRDLLSKRVTDRGVLVVAGYPRIFAPVDQWPAWRGRVCNLVTKRDANELNRLADVFDQGLREAVEKADPSGDRILFVSRAELFDGEGRSHSLCGRPTTEWLNGITLGLGDGSLRPEHSFHPNEPGHAATAEAVANQVERRLGPRLAPATTTTSKATPTPTTDAPPVTSGRRFDIGDRFSATCTVAWPTAPVRGSDSIQMTMDCRGVPGQFPLVQVIYGDPDLPVTPSRSTMRVDGTINDIAQSEFGFKLLVVEADEVALE